VARQIIRLSRQVIHSAALSGGYRYTIVKDPQYVYSLRRLRKYGTLKLVSNLAKMELDELLGFDPQHQLNKDLYPMLGGSFFDENNNQPTKYYKRYLNEIQKLLEKISSL
jgi:hypothetical protein